LTLLILFLIRSQTFSAADIVPNLYAIAATAVVPSVLSNTQGILHQYGLFGDLVHVGGVGAVFAAFVYVYHH
jgi:oligosaccharide translocation protein RFT1